MADSTDKQAVNFDEIEDLIDEIELTMSVLGPTLLKARQEAIEEAERAAAEEAAQAVERPSGDPQGGGREDAHAQPLAPEGAAADPAGPAVIDFEELDALVAALELPLGALEGVGEPIPEGGGGEAGSGANGSGDAAAAGAAEVRGGSPIPPTPQPDARAPSSPTGAADAGPAALFDLDGLKVEPAPEGGPPAPSHRASLPGGGTASQRQVGEIVHELAATARSFVLYDPRNDAIKNLLTTLLRSVDRALTAFGSLTLQVEPFEIHYDGGCVYIDRDWESSLAFRLYRDGVRSLTLERGLGWQELTALLEILSVRFTGIQQYEDDLVTLFWRAGLPHIHLVAVEGIEAEGARALEEGAEEIRDLPPTFDLPLDPLPAPVEVEAPQLGDEARLALLAELSEASLPAACLSLTGQIAAILRDPAEDLALGAVLHLYSEISAWLASEGELAALTDHLRALAALAEADAPGWDPARREAAAHALTEIGRPDALARLWAALPPPTGEPPPALVAALNLAVADPLDAVAAALDKGPGGDARGHGRQLLIHYGARFPLRLKLRFKDATGPLLADLLYAIARADGDDGVSFVIDQLAHRDPDARDAALELISGLPYSGAIGRALSLALRDSAGPHRSRVLTVIAATGDGRFVEQLVGLMEEEAKSQGLDGAWAVGQALGQLGGPRHLPRWREWVRPEGLLIRSLPGPTWRQVGAAAALGEIPAAEALGALRAALKVADEPARGWIGRAISRHHAVTQEAR